MKDIPWKEIISGGVALLSFLLKKPTEDLLQRMMDWVLLKFNRGKKSVWLSKKKNEEITNLCNQVLAYGFDRVTVVQYDNYKRVPTTIEEYAKMELTVTHEAVRPQFVSIKDEFKDMSCAPFAEGIMLLQEAEEGWIRIPSERLEAAAKRRLMKVQNLYNVPVSYRFKLNDHVVNGILACSRMAEEGCELNPDEIEEVRGIAQKIYFIKHRK